MTDIDSITIPVISIDIFYYAADISSQLLLSQQVNNAIIINDIFRNQKSTVRQTEAVLKRKKKIDMMRKSRVKEIAVRNKFIGTLRMAYEDYKQYTQQTKKMRTRKGPSTPSIHSSTPYLTEKQEKNCTGQPASTRKWTKQENQAYIEFLQDSKKLFDLSSTRRSQKIFLEMSLFVRTRSPDQCRTHHQKIFNRYGSIDKILTGFLEDQARKKSCIEFVERTLEENKFYKLRQIGPHIFCISIDESEIQEW